MIIETQGMPSPQNRLRNTETSTKVVPVVRHSHNDRVGSAQLSKILVSILGDHEALMIDGRVSVS
jgi:hypothetical protein